MIHSTACAADDAQLASLEMAGVVVPESIAMIIHVSRKFRIFLFLGNQPGFSQNFIENLNFVHLSLAFP